MDDFDANFDDAFFGEHALVENISVCDSATASPEGETEKRNDTTATTFSVSDPATPASPAPTPIPALPLPAGGVSQLAPGLVVQAFASSEDYVAHLERKLARLAERNTKPSVASSALRRGANAVQRSERNPVTRSILDHAADMGSSAGNVSASNASSRAVASTGAAAFEPVRAGEADEAFFRLAAIVQDFLDADADTKDAEGNSTATAASSAASNQKAVKAAVAAAGAEDSAGVVPKSQKEDTRVHDLTPTPDRSPVANAAASNAAVASAPEKTEKPAA